MERVVVTGSTGFIGYHLVKELLRQGKYVYAIMRPNSRNRKRLVANPRLKIIEIAMADILQLPFLLKDPCDIFYHLAWEGGRNEFVVQNDNVKYTLCALETAKRLSCKRFICTGSQAEYGLQNGLITEETLPKPITAYGSAKLAACTLTRFFAIQLEIEWIWLRLFSVYGTYDNPKALIPYLFKVLQTDANPRVSAATQNWDYLYATDAAKAMICVAEKGKTDEIYNIASGDTQPLKYFIEQIRERIAPRRKIIYGGNAVPFISLMPSVDKVILQTGWSPMLKFLDGINDIIKQENL